MWEWFLKFQKPIVGLPVTLTNFAAISYDTYTKLTWTTQTESNNSYFVVERSEDGLNFTEAARIAFYTCSKSVDTPKPKKTVYYRIKQVDKDGKTTTYNVVTVKE
jgi:hypothetical protein